MYKDLDGHTKPGHPLEREGYSAWAHGVTVFAGGVPHDVPVPHDQANHGTVLYTSATLAPDMRGELRLKTGAVDERQGVSGAQPHWIRPAHDAVAPELNHGTVLATFPHLQPNMAYSYRTNIAGGRPTERLGVRGGFTPGVVICAGGAARDVPIAAERHHGTVLYTSAALRPDASQEPRLKQGTCYERQGRVGSFEHGDAHLRMPSAADAALWKEAGQKGGRRFAEGHYLAGTTIFAGTVPGATPCCAH
ncbi:hypothetical protein JKP88DRAFT_226597 [Tribonema minus]|uniref:Uncharacterized protein n=1 Tax=Tribonema minus TaxID=303371 RepID=A0A835YKS3_9STRA|nr:hypothetical protein JKP88DRAFT_226597 [Tribonema minus]